MHIGSRLFQTIYIALVVSLSALSSAFAQDASKSPVTSPGYYPGRASVIYKYDNEKYVGWLRNNSASIAEVDRKIAAIKAGALEPGCVGRDASTCVASLAQTLVVSDDGDGPMSLFAPSEVDVNGKQIGGDIKTLYAYRPKATGEDFHIGRNIDITLRLDSSGIVKEFSAKLLGGVFFAHTQDEYDRTGAYELITAMTHVSCPIQTPNDVAKFIENVVKPRIKHGQSETDIDWEGASETRKSHADNVPYCGQLLSFSSLSGHMTQLIDENNDNGNFYNEFIDFRNASSDGGKNVATHKK